VASALELLVEFLGGPINACGSGECDPEYVSMWRAAAEAHEEDAATKREYATLCRHPSLFDRPRPEWFVPSFREALESGAGENSLRSIVTEVAPGIFTFDMLAHDFCDQLVEEATAYEASGLPVARPNSMNNYGTILNSIGMERAMDWLQRTYVAPLAQLLFPIEGAAVDHHHTFMVQYRQAEDLGLDMHTDACDVTLNVCLGREFTGAGLTFCGLRGDAGSDERRLQYRHTHVKGRAIMHLGHQRHGADDIQTGERFNLIMWNKSSTFRLSRAFMDKYSRAPSDRGKPDLVCLSYTHDSDYEKYRPYPPGKRPKPNVGG